jgi:hypothetical protein
MLASALLLAGCHAAPSETDAGGDTDATVADGCRVARDPDAPRPVVVSFPYDAVGGPASAWDVLELDGGELSRPGRPFVMGRASGGTVAFSADGSLGIAVQEDGTLGVFTLADGVATVVESAWNADETFYAGTVVFDPSGDRAWVLDPNWVENGGGIYAIALDACTGAPALEGKLLDTKLALAAFPVASGTVLVAAGVGDAEGADAWLLDDELAVVDRVVLFDYADAIPSVAAMAGDVLIVGENSQFSGQDNRIAAARLGGGFAPAGERLVEDPYGLAAGPDGDAILVASGFGDALYAAPIGAGDPAVGALVEVARPPLPGGIVVVRDGADAGLALLPENTGIHLAKFLGGGDVEDRGTFAFGSGLDDIPGAIGIP